MHIYNFEQKKKKNEEEIYIYIYNVTKLSELFTKEKKKRFESISLNRELK